MKAERQSFATFLKEKTGKEAEKPAQDFTDKYSEHFVLDYSSEKLDFIAIGKLLFEYLTTVKVGKACNPNVANTAVSVAALCGGKMMNIVAALCVHPGYEGKLEFCFQEG